MSATSAVSIVLVHGLWSDGSCWNAIIPGLLAQGHEVISGYIWVKREGIPHFAGDLSNEVQDMSHATQGPGQCEAV